MLHMGCILHMKEIVVMHEYSSALYLYICTETLVKNICKEMCTAALVMAWISLFQDGA